MMRALQQIIAIGGWLRGNRARTLLYHSISDTPSDRYAITPDLFRQQIQWIHARGFRVLPGAELVRAVRAGRALSKCLTITFDDAYSDFCDVAAPILAEFGYPATVFVPTGKIGLRSDWSSFAPPRPLMDSATLAHMISMGFELGGHTASHVALPSLTDEQLRAELAGSYAELRQITGRDDIPFAYPYGRSGRRERQAVIDAGYSSAYLAGGLWGNGARSDLFALTRITMRRVCTIDDFKRLVTGRDDVRTLLRSLIQERKARKHGSQHASPTR